MRRIERECNRTISSALTAARAALAAVTVMTAVATGRAQDFADLKRALVDYSKAENEPRKACEALARFKSKEIARISATMVPAGEAAAHCRVTGLIPPRDRI